MTYHVRLTQFEGPLDLLLHLIRRDKINIYDIPISHITREYLAYIEIMQELELEIAGEFFVMAATLMRIKSQMLLPRHEELDEAEADPRDELVKNLLEYRTFKEAAQCFAAKEDDRRRVFTRSAVPLPEEETPEDTTDITLFDLLEALQGVFKNMKATSLYRIMPESITVEEKIEVIRGHLDKRSEVLFTELFAAEFTKMELIVTFLAILEMIKLGQLLARQLSHGSDIWLYKPGIGSYVERRVVHRMDSESGFERDESRLEREIEALLFASDAPLAAGKITALTGAASTKQVLSAIDTLTAFYRESNRSYTIIEVAGGYQFTTLPEFSSLISRLFKGRKKAKLTQPALETLAIVAYKQPISRMQIEAIRGVNCDGVLATLIERELVSISGRGDGIGKPFLYSTTKKFLEYLGLKDFRDLPSIEELERKFTLDVAVEKPLVPPPGTSSDDNDTYQIKEQ